MAIGIKIKKFTGLDYQLNFNLFRDINDLNNKPSGKYGSYTIPKVFYQQALYRPCIGNQVYKEIVNFHNRLTNTKL